ncbi:MAG: GFA family protein [Alphaproteobacteria bacterium]|nr:GFA family protein [Alphaproteobacteria bacterium]
MTENSEPVPSITGGCQCGAVRYAMHVPRVENAHACHCRMCQKATGGVFAVLAGCSKDRLEWTRGRPSFFASSNVASRGFCPGCGTPLTFAYNQPEARIYVTIGSLDDPEQAAIGRQYGVESKLSWVRFCEDVVQERSGETAEDAAFFASIRSNQDGVGGEST